MGVKGCDAVEVHFVVNDGHTCLLHTGVYVCFPQLNLKNYTEEETGFYVFICVCTCSDNVCF